MKTVLVFGAGMVARPLIEYFLQRKYPVVVASKAFTPGIEALLESHPAGKKVSVDVMNPRAVNSLVKSADVVISLLPYTIHHRVVESCLQFRKHLITTSYLRDDVERFHPEALAKDTLILMEAGMDPGIDHMSARSVIDRVHGEGGMIESFDSYCGGLPAPSAADNPWKYKFSWSPKGVLLAARNSARYLEKGKIVKVPAEELHLQTQPIVVNTHRLEVFPNRDALPYVSKYNIGEAASVFRGTLRYPGWSHTMHTIRELGLLEETPLTGLAKLSNKNILAKILGHPPNDGVMEAVRKQVTRTGEPVEQQRLLERLKWIGLFSDDPYQKRDSSPIDFLNELMLQRMQYREGEQDMILLQHRFEVRYPWGRERIVATLECYGYPGQNGATAQCVSYPAAAAARLILDGKIKERGTRIPVDREIYQPVLAELEALGIRFQEQRMPLAGA